MPPMTKMMTTKPIISSVWFLSAFSRTTEINNNNIINIDDQRARAPSIQIFANQLKHITWEKFKILVLKVSISGPLLTFLLSAMQ